MARTETAGTYGAPDRLRVEAAPSTLPQARPRSPSLLPGAADSDGAPYGTALDRASDRDRSRKLFAALAGAAGFVTLASLYIGGDAAFRTSTLLARTGMVAVSLAGLLWTLPPPNGVQDLRWVDAVVYASSAALLGILCVADGGHASPLVHLMTCLIVAQGLALRDRRRDRALRVALSGGAFIAAYLAAAPRGIHPTGLPLLLGQKPLELVKILVVLGLVAAIVLVAPPAADERRRTAGRYVLEKLIGDGGMAEVWLGHGPASPHAVAVKVMHPDSLDPQAIMRFGREVTALSELRHESTVRVLDWGVASGVFYYVMELLHGETLQALVAREGPLPPRRAMTILRRVAGALTEAHAAGIIHRDIKPENIFILPGDAVKVLDFGVAKLPDRGEPTEATITRIGTAVGTPSYMAPEQILTDPVDARTDIYALGATLFFALTGRPPFTGPARQIFRSHLQAAVPDPSIHSPHPVPLALRALVMRCLQKPPSRRYPSMRTVDAALTAVLAGTPLPESLRPSPASDPPTMRIRRSTLPPLATHPVLPADASPPVTVRAKSLPPGGITIQALPLRDDVPVTPR